MCHLRLYLNDTFVSSRCGMVKEMWFRNFWEYRMRSIVKPCIPIDFGTIFDLNLIVFPRKYILKYWKKIDTGEILLQILNQKSITTTTSTLRYLWYMNSIK